MDRLAREIEVTEAMLEAGERALAARFLAVAEADVEAQRIVVKEIFNQMMEARRKVDREIS